MAPSESKSQKNINELIKKWNGWIKDIEKDLTELLLSRHYYQELGEIVKSNSKLKADPANFHKWIVKNYGISIAVGIRRQIDSDSRSISLKNFLQDVKKNLYCITRDQFLIGNKANQRSNDKIRNRYFDKLAGKGKKFVDSDIIQKDLCALSEKSKIIRKFVNKKVAHLDRGHAKLKNLPTYDDLDDTLDLMEKTFNKYRTLIQYRSYELTPVVINDWKRIFTYPWITPDPI
ncbi:MAG: hypothetical protein ACNS63_07200 [Candidatus Nitrospinota bacterium M3_3B_026]